MVLNMIGSNLNEVIESVLNKNVNVVDKYREMYDRFKHIVLHYYDLIKNLSELKQNENINYRCVRSSWF